MKLVNVDLKSLGSCLGLLALVLLLACGPAARAESRISGPVDPAIRCAGTALPQETCARRQKRGLESGCINQEEYEVLVRYGSAPNCVDDGDGAVLAGWCPCGCFHPDVLIKGFAGDSKVPEEIRADDIARNFKEYRLAHLGTESKPGDFRAKVAPVRMSTIGKEVHPLVVIHLANGRTLRVTRRHAILTAQGSLVRAEELDSNQLLVSEAGLPVEIRGLSTEPFEGEVVNFQAEVASPIEHVIFAEGVAVGDQAWQSSLEDDLNRIIIRQ